LPPPAPDAIPGLRYVADAEPGIRRLRRGRGFGYLDPEGRALRDPEHLARIRALAIPPAWTEVWICLDAVGHIQATGRDQSGRKQYRYHARWLEERSSAKYLQLAAFGRRLPALRDQVETDLRRRGLAADKVVATVVWLLDNTLIRIGNDAYAIANKSFGLTTLRNRHVEITGQTLRFRFVGKSGKSWQLRLSDRRIARTVRAIQTLPGQRLFQYRDDEGTLRQVASNDVNAYIRAVMGETFSSKDFRTWGGTVRALSLLARTPPPATRAEERRVLNAVVDQVARELGNTRAVCRACYIHPRVLARWAEGALAGDIEALGRVRARKALDEDETLALRWLELFEEAENAAASPAEGRAKASA
jgi:DNA topoisomerase I